MPSERQQAPIKAPPVSGSGVFSSAEDLAAVCKRMRRDIVTMMGKAGSGHPGGSLSAVERSARFTGKSCGTSRPTRCGRTGTALS